MSPTLVITLSIVTIVFAVIVYRRILEFRELRQKRVDALLSWARANGLQHSQRHVFNISASMERFPCFLNGKKRRFTTLIWGTYRGYSMVAGDFHYKRENTAPNSNRFPATLKFSFVLFTPAFHLPSFIVREEDTHDRLRARWGKNDIDFESAKFSEHFFVDCDDRRWAYDAISPRTMELLLANPSIVLQCEPSTLLVTTGHWVTPGDWGAPQFERFANLGVEFLNNIPPYARQPLPA